MNQNALILSLLIFPSISGAEFKLSGKWIYNEYKSDNDYGHYLAMTKDEKSSASLGVIANPDINACSPILVITEENKKDLGEGEIEIDVELRVDTLGKWVAKDQTMKIFGSKVELYIIPDDDWSLISELMTGLIARIKFEDWIGRFSLNGSKRAISEAVSRCLKYSELYGDQKYFDDPPPSQMSSDPDEKFF